MLTARSRFAVIAVALILLSWTLREQVYEISALIFFGILFIVYGYFKEGTVVLAARAYHKKDLQKAEVLLKQIPDPDRLKRTRRGYYEFIYGNIELKRNNLDEAERHFQIASRFPFKNENEKGLVLVQLANLNLGKREFKKAGTYASAAKRLQTGPRVKNIIENLESQLRKQSEY